MSNHPEPNILNIQAVNPPLALNQSLLPTSFHTNYCQTFPGFSFNPFIPYPNPYPYDLLYSPYQPHLLQPAHYPSFYAQQGNFINQLKPAPNGSFQSTFNESAEGQQSSSSSEARGRHSIKATKRSLQGSMVEGSKYKINKKGKKNFTSYYWSLQQNKRYSEFLKVHPGLFDLSVSEKKNLRVNVMMSKKIKSRTPQQCHSHHQKMMKKYGSIEHIITGLRDQREIILEGKKMARDQVKDQVGIEQDNHDL